MQEQRSNENIAPIPGTRSDFLEALGGKKGIKFPRKRNLKRRTVDVPPGTIRHMIMELALKWHPQ